MFSLTTRTNQQWEEFMAQGKSYEISKQVVWEAYKRVKANRGAAGVDQQSLETSRKT